MDRYHRAQISIGLAVMIFTAQDSLFAALRDFLTDRGMTVSGGAAEEDWRAADFNPDCLVVDAASVKFEPSMLADILSGADCAVVVLAPEGAPLAHRVEALEHGADDYLVHPVNPRELLARIRAVHRGRRIGALKAVNPSTYLFANYALDAPRRILTDHRGGAVTLSRSAFLLLKCFLDNPHRTLARSALAEVVGAEGTEASDRAIDVQVSRLRSQLRGDGRDLINTIYGEGYQFVGAVQHGGSALARR
jgi:DNA-binding response OmpR family regulator